MANEFAKAGARLVADLGSALEHGAHEVMAVSDILVPKDTETLRESAEVFPVRTEAGRLVVEFGYGFGSAVNPKTGRLAAEYAVPVHEILEATHAPPTQAKFLEAPVMAYASEMEKTIGDELRVTWEKP